MRIHNKQSVDRQMTVLCYKSSSARLCVSETRHNVFIFSSFLSSAFATAAGHLTPESFPLSEETRSSSSTTSRKRAKTQLDQQK